MTLYKFRQSLTATEPLAASRIDARTRRVFVARQGRLGAGARVCSAGEASRVVLLKIPVLIGLRGLDFRLTILIFL